MKLVDLLRLVVPFPRPRGEAGYDAELHLAALNVVSVLRIALLIMNVMWHQFFVVSFSYSALFSATVGGAVRNLPAAGALISLGSLIVASVVFGDDDAIIAFIDAVIREGPFLVTAVPIELVLMRLLFESQVNKFWSTSCR